MTTPATLEEAIATIQQLEVERDAAQSKARGLDGVISKFLGKMEIADHVANESAGLDPGDRLAFIFARSGTWKTPTFDRPEKLTHEDKAARAISARRYL